MGHFLPFEWIAAIRFLREGAAQTTMIVIGVSVGVAVIVFMSALLAGLQANFLRRMFASQAQIVLLTPDEVARPLRRMAGVAVLPTVIKPNQRLRSIDQWQRIRKETEKRPDVLAVSPMVSGAAFAVRGDSSKGITLMGVDPSVFYKVVKIPEKIVTGTARLKSDDVLIGIQLASDLGVVVGDKIRITASTGASQILLVAGTFDLGNKGANQRSAIFESPERRTVASYERELAGHRSVETRLRDALVREETLLRQKDDLIQQQELLSKESDHRLLNDLQMIVSLLRLQSRASTNPEVASQLVVAANRVATIGRVHWRLHSFDGVQTVAFKQYLEDLCRDFSAMLSSEEPPERVIVVEGIEVKLPTATGIPLGFISRQDKRGFWTMNRSVLYLIIGALVVATAVLGYQFYQERQKATGIEINVGKSGISIEKK